MVTATPLNDLLAIEKLREQELEEARIIQGAMLPSHPLHEFGIIVSHEFQPVTAVGGDYLDYFSLSDGTIGLYLGDVSGKGLPAALYAALAIGTLRGIHKTGRRPGRVLSLLNDRLHLRGIPGRHTSIQYVIFYPSTGEMILSACPAPFCFVEANVASFKSPAFLPACSPACLTTNSLFSSNRVTLSCFAATA